MKVKDLIKILKVEDPNREILVACDEEWNTLYKGVEIQCNGKDGELVIFGLSGTEKEEVY